MYSKEFIINQIKKVNDYWINENPQTGDAGWERGAYMIGNMAAYEMTYDNKYFEYALNWARANGWKLHSLRNKKGTCVNANSLIGGESYLRLMDVFPVEGTDEYMLREMDTLLSDEANDDWWWVDSVYMAFPYLHKLGVKYSDERYFDKAHRLYVNMRYARGLYDSEEHLWYRDERFTPDKEVSKNGKKIFWARGNGWVFAGLARGLDAMSKDCKYYEEYKAVFCHMAERIRSCMRSDGGYTTGLYDPDEFPLSETSGTALFTLGFFIGMRLGLLDETYLETAFKGFEWLNSNALQPNGKIGYVQGVSRGPDMSWEKFSDEEKKLNSNDCAVGTYLLILKELWLKNEGEVKVCEDINSWVDSICEKLDRKLCKYAKNVHGFIPGSTDGSEYIPSYGGVHSWTNGFWPGLMWLMYSGTGNEVYRRAAEHSEEILDKAFEDMEKLDHDVGFMWIPSSGYNYKLTRNKQCEKRLFKAASFLASRYNPDGGYIRAWNGDGTGRYRQLVIIDSMMNLPLLYWAANHTGDEKYKRIAMHHADKIMNHHVRADGSVNHIVRYDEITGSPICAEGGQGFDVLSSWTRGQVWGFYGFTLSYVYTGRQEYLDTAKKIANYFIAAASCEDWFVKSDFRSPTEPLLYDSTASMAAASGLLELACQVGKYEKKMYFDAALKLLKTAESNFADWSDDKAGIMQHGCIWYHGGKPDKIVYGDYYFAEAVTKLRYNNRLF